MPIRDTVVLTPLTIVETSDVTSVGVDAAVQDARGRYVAGLDASQFILREDGEPQTIDLVMSDAPAATFTLLIDSSQSMSANVPFVRHAASKLAGFLRDEDQIVVAPFRKGITAITGPTRDRATIADAVAAVDAAGRHRHRRRPAAGQRARRRLQKDDGSWCSSPTATTSTAATRSRRPSHRSKRVR